MDFFDIVLASKLNRSGGGAVNSVNGQTGTVELTAEDVGALSAETLKPAVDLALAQAKASGEFDGADGQDGVTPTIGDNGNWYLGETDTGKPSRGDKGDKGDKGDTGETGATGAAGAAGKSAYAYAQDGGYTGTEAEFAAKLAKEKFANPYALTFTGAVKGSYDGSEPVTVEIPSGGGGGETGAKEFRLVRNITLDEQSDRVDISVDSSGNAFALHEVYVMLSAQSYEDAYHEVFFLPNGLWGAGDAYITSSVSASKSSETWKNNMVFHSVYADGVICSEQLPTKGLNSMLTSMFAKKQTIITKISIACKFAAGCTFLVIGR